MVTDRLFRRLRTLLQTEDTLAQAADKAGLDEKTARKYRDSDRLPSQRRTPHTWRTREDPFQDVWPELVDQLRLNPGLQAKTLFVDLQGRFPDCPTPLPAAADQTVACPRGAAQGGVLRTDS